MSNIGLKQIDVSRETMVEFLRLLRQASSCGRGRSLRSLAYLDLSESLLDDACCSLVANIDTLKSVVLNKCANITTAGITTLLEGRVIDDSYNN